MLAILTLAGVGAVERASGSPAGVCALLTVVLTLTLTAKRVRAETSGRWRALSELLLAGIALADRLLLAVALADRLLRSVALADRLLLTVALSELLLRTVAASHRLLGLRLELSRLLLYPLSDTLLAHRALLVSLRPNSCGLLEFNDVRSCCFVFTCLGQASELFGGNNVFLLCGYERIGGLRIGSANDFVSWGNVDNVGLLNPNSLGGCDK